MSHSFCDFGLYLPTFEVLGVSSRHIVRVEILRAFLIGSSLMISRSSWCLGAFHGQFLILIGLFYLSFFGGAEGLHVHLASPLVLSLGLGTMLAFCGL
jgi:hypothetical protein